MKMMPVYERYVMSVLREKHVVRMDELTRIPAHIRRVVVDELVKRGRVVRIPGDRIASEVTEEVVNMLADEVISEAERLEKVLERIRTIRPDLTGRSRDLSEIKMKMMGIDRSDLRRSFDEALKARDEVERIREEIRSAV